MYQDGGLSYLCKGTERMFSGSNSDLKSRGPCIFLSDRQTRHLRFCPIPEPLTRHSASPLLKLKYIVANSFESIN
jgi:hypothetical protein